MAERRHDKIHAKLKPVIDNRVNVILPHYFDVSTAQDVIFDRVYIGALVDCAIWDHKCARQRSTFDLRSDVLADFQWRAAFTPGAERIINLGNYMKLTRCFVDGSFGADQPSLPLFVADQVRFDEYINASISRDGMPVAFR